MENASKALIMAGAILIAILIISLSILIFTRFQTAAEQETNMDKEMIQSFNSKISPYLGTISSTQVNALLQYCLSVNLAAKQAEETEKIITVSYPPSKTLDGSSTTYSRVPSGKYYNVDGTPNSKTGLITTIKITEK